MLIFWERNLFYGKLFLYTLSIETERGNRIEGFDLYTTIEPEIARQLLEKSRQFVDEVEQWLRHNRWL